MGIFSHTGATAEKSIQEFVRAVGNRHGARGERAGTGREWSRAVLCDAGTIGVRSFKEPLGSQGTIGVRSFNITRQWGHPPKLQVHRGQVFQYHIPARIRACPARCVLNSLMPLTTSPPAVIGARTSAMMTLIARPGCESMAKHPDAPGPRHLAWCWIGSRDDGFRWGYDSAQGCSS